MNIQSYQREIMLKHANNRFNAQELWQMDHDHVLHPYTHFDSFKKDGSLVLVEGEVLSQGFRISIPAIRKRLEELRVGVE